jgi:hypothetical protein
MLVETYEVNELLADGTLEEMSSPEALALIEEMGLKGQRSLLRQLPAGNDDTVMVRCPYRLITAEEAAIFGVLCPERTPLADYASGPIPLRVLQVAAHARSMFELLIVLHPTDAAVKDPVLIGIMRVRNRHEWDDEHSYILARWGDELPSLEELREAACNKLRDIMAAKVTAARAELESLAARMETAVPAYLRGQPITVPYFDLSFGAQ